MRRTCFVVFAVTAFAFIAPSVQASLAKLDQYNGFPDQEVIPDYLYGVGDSDKMAQTFTAGMTGYLDHIEIGNTTDFAWEEISPLSVQIQSGAPDSDVLGFVTLDEPVPYDNWLSISFPDTIRIEAGDMYSIVLWATDGSASVSVGATANSDYYLDGALWETNDAGSWQLVSSVDPTKAKPVFDMQFRTYVIPVPLPAGVWLGICAVGVAGLHLKRQHV